MKVKVNYIKTYNKSVCKVIDIPEGESVDDYLHINKLELFEDEITAASLDLDGDEFEILDEEPTRKEKSDWFYSHDAEWQNDMEQEFQTNDNIEGHLVDWAYDKFNGWTNN